MAPSLQRDARNIQRDMAQTMQTFRPQIMPRVHNAFMTMSIARAARSFPEGACDRGHLTLILGFNIFLPPQVQIGIDPPTDTMANSAIKKKFDAAMKLVTKIRVGLLRRPAPSEPAARLMERRCSCACKPKRTNITDSYRRSRSTRPKKSRFIRYPSTFVPYCLDRISFCTVPCNTTRSARL